MEHLDAGLKKVNNVEQYGQTSKGNTNLDIFLLTALKCSKKIILKMHVLIHLSPVEGLLFGDTSYKNYICIGILHSTHITWF
jgi:hypothetical protein